MLYLAILSQNVFYPATEHFSTQLIGTSSFRYFLQLNGINAMYI